MNAAQNPFFPLKSFSKCAVMVLQTPATFTSATHYCGKVMGLVFLSLNVSFVTTALDKLVVSLLKKPTRAGAGF